MGFLCIHSILHYHYYWPVIFLWWYPNINHIAIDVLHIFIKALCTLEILPLLQFSIYLIGISFVIHDLSNNPVSSLVFSNYLNIFHVSFFQIGNFLKSNTTVVCLLLPLCPDISLSQSWKTRYDIMINVLFSTSQDLIELSWLKLVDFTNILKYCLYCLRCRFQFSAFLIYICVLLFWYPLLN